MCKRWIFVLALLCFLSSLAPVHSQEATLLGERIYSDLLELQRQILESNKRLETLNGKLSQSENEISGLKLLQAEKEQLQNEKENELKALSALLDRREATLKQLSLLVDDQRTSYKKSLNKWRFSTITLGILSTVLLGVVVYQKVSE